MHPAGPHRAPNGSHRQGTPPRCTKHAPAARLSGFDPLALQRGAGSTVIASTVRPSRRCRTQMPPRSYGAASRKIEGEPVAVHRPELLHLIACGNFVLVRCERCEHLAFLTCRHFRPI